MMPVVTVLLSVYNGERYLGQAIESILRQTFADLEFIIIDDGSTDHTREILQRYDDPRIVHMRNETNIGLTRSLNKGLKLAQGKYIARQDADDVSLPERLRRQIRFLDEHPQVDLVGSFVAVLSSEGEIITELQPPTENQALQALLLRRNPFCHGSVTLRRAAVERVGGYREAFVRAQDYDLWLRLAEIGQVANLPDVLYQWRFTPGSVSLRHKRQQTAFDALAKECALRRRHGLPEPDLVIDVHDRGVHSWVPSHWASRSIQARYYLEWAKGKLVQRADAAAAREHLRQSLRLWPLHPSAWAWWLLTWIPAHIIHCLWTRKRLARRGGIGDSSTKG